MKVRLAIASDHRGFVLMQSLLAVNTIGNTDLIWHDCGTHTPERCDYPSFAFAACDLLLNNQVDGGILLCGSGIGMAIAANRVPHVYAGLVWCPKVARTAREDDNCSLISIPADYCNFDQAMEIIEEWLSASFKKGRYQLRLEMIDKRVSGE